ncbi:MAG: serine hydrolase [Planctomycetes bacterium]|nr:serine hydrolase [Planctomycetota bacterium]
MDAHPAGSRLGITRRAALALAAALTAAAGRAEEKPSATPEVPLWGRFEARVVNETRYANPFTDVVLQATFTRPGGGTVLFWGFHDGDGMGGQDGRVWRLRFMPDELGEWRYACKFSDGAPGTSGTFRCVASGAGPGPLRADPENPRWFRFAGGSRKRLHGYYYLDFWSDLDDAWRAVVEDVVLADGYTLVMPMSYVRGPGTVGECGQPVQRTYAWDTIGDKVDWTRFDLATWRRLDERLAWAADRGLAVYTFDGLFPNIGAKVPPEPEELYLRYTLARHVPFWNVLWNVGFECWEVYAPEQVKAWAARLKALDPWKHPVTWHDQGYGAQLSADERAAWSHAAPEADYGSLQQEFRTARAAYDFVAGSFSGKPVFGCECNWEQLQDVYGKPRTREEVRRGIWGVGLAGAISLYADWTADYDPTQGKTTRRYGRGKGRADVRRMHDLLSRIPWWTMAPRADLVPEPGPVCLAAAGRRYLVYAERGSAIALDLPAGTYAGEWLDPRDGAAPDRKPIEPFDWSGGVRRFPGPGGPEGGGGDGAGQHGGGPDGAFQDDRALYVWAVPEAARYFPPPESRGGWRKLEKPEEVRKLAGMDPERLEGLRRWLLESDERGFAAVVIRHGHIALEVERGNSSRTDARRVASVSKAVCATVLAIASERSQRGLAPRKMRFDDPAFDFIAWAHPLSDPRKAKITVRQLLNHTSGICPEATGAPNSGTWEYVLGHSGDARTEKLAFDPGAGCGYSTHALHHAALACETVTGMPYDRFAIEALFRPLGIERWWFESFEGGEKHGRHPSHGMGMPARDLARIAYCMLRGGRWGEEQVIPRWFVEETAAPTHAVTGPELRFKIDARTFSHGWELPAKLTGGGGRSGGEIPADARHKPGSGGQLIAFVPSLDLVVARQTGSSGDWKFEEFLRLACQAVAIER